MGDIVLTTAQLWHYGAMAVAWIVAAILAFLGIREFCGACRQKVAAYGDTMRAAGAGAPVVVACEDDGEEEYYEDDDDYDDYDDDRRPSSPPSPPQQARRRRARQ